MNTDKNTPRFLGAAFLIVALTSLIGGMTRTPAVGTGSISEMLVSVSENLTLIRISVVAEMVTSAGIIVLSALLYIVLGKQNKVFALVGLGCWLGEAIFLALSQMGILALVTQSLNFVQAGGAEPSYAQTLGQYLFQGVFSAAYTVLMWFYCIGGIFWYYLFYKSNYVPRLISLFGLAAVGVGAVGIVARFFGNDVPIFVFLPILPFELAIGLWLLLKGINEGAAAKLKLANAT